MFAAISNAGSKSFMYCNAGSATGNPNTDAPGPGPASTPEVTGSSGYSEGASNEVTRDKSMGLIGKLG